MEGEGRDGYRFNPFYVHTYSSIPVHGACILAEVEVERSRDGVWESLKCEVLREIAILQEKRNT